MMSAIDTVRAAAAFHLRNPFFTHLPIQEGVSAAKAWEQQFFAPCVADCASKRSAFCECCL